ncbi:SPRY domain containing protein [Gracilaria domingensis]|nr:SPRY domain containing protein [Gracilaria domingensis]
MRPPIYSLEQAVPLHRFRRRAADPLCFNGVCTVHAGRHHIQPLAFSEDDKADHLQCSHAGLVVTYNGPGREEKDAASIRTSQPIPPGGIALYYFEISIVDQGDTGRIGVGLCDRKVRLGKMPGWEAGSYAYHGDDGLLFRQTGIAGNSYGPKYGTGDVIGCCWDLVDNIVFFTRNGKNLGTAFTNLSGVLYPTVGMQSMNGSVSANFGHKSFAFDIETYARQQRDKILATIMSKPLPQDYTILTDTVLMYLMHNGYSQTAAAFAKDAGREQIYQRERDSMLKRQAVCDKVLQGDIDAAIYDLEKQFPQVLKSQLNVRFLLLTQKFIEMIVSGASLEETVEYGRRELSVFRDKEYVKSAQESDDSISKTDKMLPFADILRDVYLLLAYGNPAESPTGHLTKQSRRETVADNVNSAILASQGRPMRSLLERFICQNENILKHLMLMGNGPAALVSAQDML